MMNKLLWRIVFTATVIDCLEGWMHPKRIRNAWETSKCVLNHLGHPSRCNPRERAYLYLTHLKG